MKVPSKKVFTRQNSSTNGPIDHSGGLAHVTCQERASCDTEALRRISGDNHKVKTTKKHSEDGESVSLPKLHSFPHICLGAPKISGPLSSLDLPIDPLRAGRAFSSRNPKLRYNKTTMKKSSFDGRRRPLLIVVVVVALVLVVTRFVSIKSNNALSADTFGILLMFNENDKKQEEFFKKLEKMQQLFYVQQEERLAQLERQNEILLEQVRLLKVPPDSMSLREKLVYMMPYDPKARFPAYVWQLWKHGLNDDRFDEAYKEGQAQWAFKNPGFVHELFNDDTSHTVVRHLFNYIPEVIEAYESMPEVILKMDFFRYLILFARGGVYADIDTYPLQPVPNWIPENVSPTELGLIISVGTDSNSPNWRQENHRRLEFGQFVIQSKPGHPILRELIAQITETTLSRKRRLGEGQVMHLEGSPNQRQLEISRWTGAGAWTDVVMNYLNDYVKSSIYQSVSWREFHDLDTPKLVSDILVLPIKSFASELAIPKDNKVSDPIAFVKHYLASIWKTT